MSLDRALELVLAHEGGFVDHPDDRGGATRYGITEGTLYRARQDLGDLPSDVRDLSRDEARRIYADLYWTPSLAHALPWPASYVHMDAAVQHGVGRAVRFLQAALGVTVDGRVGPETRGATQAVRDWRPVTADMLTRRSLYYIRILADRSQASFARGWANRLEEVADLARDEHPEEEDDPG